MTLKAYLGVARRRWKVLAVTAMLVFGLAAVLTVLTPPTYAATATAFVSLGSTAATDTAGSGIFQQSQFALQRVKSYTELVESPQVLQPVIDDLDLDTTVSELAGQVSATNPIDTVLLNVTASASSAELAADIANRVTDQLGLVIENLERPPEGGPSPVQVTTVVFAENPPSPASPRTLLNLVLGLLAGLAAGVIAAVVRDQQDTTMTVDDVERLTGSAPIGVVGYSDQYSRRPLGDVEQGGPMSADFRFIRTNLQFIDVDDPPRVIVVTSAVGGEGKTVTACNLALTLAQLSHSVCVVEADLRRPRAAQCFGLGRPTQGLSNVIAGHVELKDAVVPYGDGRLTLLPAGTLPPSPSDLLGSQNMRSLIELLRGEYDYVVIDSPPVLPVPDAAILSALAQGTLLVVRHRKARQEQVQRALDDLAAARARVLGVVMTFVPARSQRERRGHDDGYRYRAGLETGARSARRGRRLMQRASRSS